MAARDPKLPVVIDLEEDDSVSLIPWEFVVDKCDGIVGGGPIMLNSFSTPMMRKILISRFL